MPARSRETTPSLRHGRDSPDKNSRKGVYCNLWRQLDVIRSNMLAQCRRDFIASVSCEKFLLQTVQNSPRSKSLKIVCSKWNILCSALPVCNISGFFGTEAARPGSNPASRPAQWHRTQSNIKNYCLQRASLVYFFSLGTIKWNNKNPFKPNNNKWRRNYRILDFASAMVSCHPNRRPEPGDIRFFRGRDGSRGIWHFNYIGKLFLPGNFIVFRPVIHQL